MGFDRGRQQGLAQVWVFLMSEVPCRWCNWDDILVFQPLIFEAFYAQSSLLFSNMVLSHLS